MLNASEREATYLNYLNMHFIVDLQALACENVVFTLSCFSLPTYQMDIIFIQRLVMNLNHFVVKLQ